MSKNVSHMMPNSIIINNSKSCYLQSHRHLELVTGPLFLPHLPEFDQANLQLYTETRKQEKKKKQAHFKAKEFF